MKKCTPKYVLLTLLITLSGLLGASIRNVPVTPSPFAISSSDFLSLHLNDADALLDRGKKKKKETEAESKEKAELRIKKNEEAIARKRESQLSMSRNDRSRKRSIEVTNDKKDQCQKNSEEYERKGDVQIEENKLKSESRISKLSHRIFGGELIRRLKDAILSLRKKENGNHDSDERRAADQRIKNTTIRLERKKEKADAIAQSKEVYIKKNDQRIENQKKDIEYESRKREHEAENLQYDARKRAFDKNKKIPKSPDDYTSQTGNEVLKQGVTEKASYRLGNKMVTERLVKVGNRVDVYKKVVSKTSIFYFKNDGSITEEIWRRDTLADHE